MKQERAFWKRWVKFHSCSSNVTLLWTWGYHGPVAEISNLPSPPGVEPCFSLLCNIYLFFHLLPLKYFPSKSSILCNHKLFQISTLPIDKPVLVSGSDPLDKFLFCFTKRVSGVRYLSVWTFWFRSRKTFLPWASPAFWVHFYSRLYGPREVKCWSDLVRERKMLGANSRVPHSSWGVALPWDEEAVAVMCWGSTSPAIRDGDHNVGNSELKGWLSSNSAVKLFMGLQELLKTKVSGRAM